MPTTSRPSPDVASLRTALQAVGVRAEDLARELGCTGSYARMQLLGRRTLTPALRELAEAKVRERIGVAVGSATCALEVAAGENVPEAIAGIIAALEIAAGGCLSDTATRTAVDDVTSGLGELPGPFRLQ